LFWQRAEKTHQRLGGANFAALALSLNTPDNSRFIGAIGDPAGIKLLCRSNSSGTLLASSVTEGACIFMTLAIRQGD